MAETNFEELSAKVLDQFKTVAKTETVMGEKFSLGGFECVPVIKLSFGFGTGSGGGSSEKQGTGSGGGIGAGVNIEPVGFLVTKGDDIQMIAAAGKNKGMQSLFENLPGVIEKFAEKKKKKDKKESDDDE